jgi:hypothetical protein
MEQQSLARRDHPQMKTVTYNDEASPWSRSSHALGTRWLPSGDDSDNKFSRTLEEQKLR